MIFDQFFITGELPLNRIAGHYSLTYLRLENEILLTIKDEGYGFNWRDYMEISPERATHSHGRGIALAKMMSFDRLEYLGCGNEVSCRVALSNQYS